MDHGEYIVLDIQPSTTDTTTAKRSSPSQRIPGLDFADGSLIDTAVSTWVESGDFQFNKISLTARAGHHQGWTAHSKLVQRSLSKQ